MQKGIDYIGVSVIFIIHDGQGKIFMHKRSNQCRDEHGRWDFGGGGLEYGETFEEGVRRELLEEFGVEPVAIEYLGSRSLIRTFEDRTKVHWVPNYHLVQVDPAQVKIMEPHKVEGVGWFAPHELPGPLHSAIDDFEIDLIRRNLVL